MAPNHLVRNWEPMSSLRATSSVYEMAGARAGKKRCFDATFKLKFIHYALSQPNRVAAHHFGIDEKRVH